VAGQPARTRSGGALLERILRRGPPRRALCGFLLQKEVVERLVARPPGPANYGALSVLVAARASWSALGTLRPGASCRGPRSTAPSWASRLRSAPARCARHGRLRARRAARPFGQRRKTLRNALGAVFGRGRAEPPCRGRIAPGERAERLDLAAFLRLTAELAPALKAGSAGADRRPGRVAIAAHNCTKAVLD